MTKTAPERALECLPEVIDQLGSETFCAALMRFIASAADFDSAVIMGYPESSDLRVVYNALHDGDQPGFGGAYRDGLWLLSPLYLSAKSGQRGFFHILDIAPESFRDSDYYALYYSSNGVLDHTGFLLETGNGTPVAISLERTPALPRFSERDKAALSGISDTIAALVRRHWPADLSEGAVRPEFARPGTTGTDFLWQQSAHPPGARCGAADTARSLLQGGGKRTRHQQPDRAGTPEEHLSKIAIVVPQRTVLAVLRCPGSTPLPRHRPPGQHPFIYLTSGIAPHSFHLYANLSGSTDTLTKLRMPNEPVFDRPHPVENPGLYRWQMG